MIGLPLGLLYENAGEWLVHRYVLHGLGKRPESYWSFHWRGHHRACRKLDFYDPDYEQPAFAGPLLTPQRKETLGLLAAAVAHAPLLPVAPWFSAGFYYGLVRYYRVHKRAHLDPEWARAHVPWHYDHHMGPNQDANWCVTRPWFDYVMGTRVPYLGTARERADRARRAGLRRHAPDTTSSA
ncbi:MAG: hypothetical protein KC543_07840 [Myxococcales bacterium]|nr:hypothetical protein [Myxococcales bacterium]